MYKVPVGFSGDVSHQKGRQDESRYVSDDGSKKLLLQMAGELKALKAKVQEYEAKEGLCAGRRRRWMRSDPRSRQEDDGGAAETDPSGQRHGP